MKFIYEEFKEDSLESELSISFDYPLDEGEPIPDSVFDLIESVKNHIGNEDPSEFDQAI